MESLDLGPQPGPQAWWRRRAVAVAAAAAVLIGAGLVVVHDTRSEPGSSPDPSPVPTSRPLPTRVTTPPAPPTRHQWSIRGFLSDTDLEVFARSEDRLYRISTSNQTVTATDTPRLESGGPMIFIVDRHQVIVRGWGGDAEGFRVRDGRAPEDLPDTLTTPDGILPGPPGRLWLTSARGENPITQLTDLDGRPARAGRGPSTYPAESVQADGHRGLILSSPGGFYALGPDGPRRLTRGQLLAVGRSQVLATDCDSTLHCSRYLVDRSTGARQVVGPAPVNDDVGGNGAVSDNGHYAALWAWSRSGSVELRILDLRTQATVARLADENGAGDASSLFWLADHRLMGVLNGGLFLYDPRTGKVSRPDLDLGEIQQLGLRTRE